MCQQFPHLHNPNQGDRQGFQRIAHHRHLAEIAREKVCGAQTSQHKRKHHQGNLPFASLPRGSGVPNRHTHHGDDVAISLRAGAQNTNTNERRRQHRLPESDILILPLPEQRSHEKQCTRRKHPEIRISGASTEVTHQPQERDVLFGLKKKIVVILHRQSLHPLHIFVACIVKAKHQHGKYGKENHPYHPCPDETTFVL